MSWFHRLTGISETSPDEVREQLRVEASWLHSLANGRRFHMGTFELASLASLRARVADIAPSGPLRLSQIVADIGDLHRNPTYAGSTFQAASQFNMLEMVSPRVTPEAGIGGYEHDRTQGPVCAMACGAGTTYRNYLVPVGDEVGQSSGHQLDGLAEIGVALGNGEGRFWRMSNGYALPTEGGLHAVRQRLEGMDASEIDDLRTRLSVGIQWNTEVTQSTTAHRVTQVYCSAFPIGYSDEPVEDWEPLARLVLEASYEACFAASVSNRAQGGRDTLFLTLVGGGVFRNPVDWILDAISRAAAIYANHALDCKIVSYGSRRHDIDAALSRMGYQ